MMTEAAQPDLELGGLRIWIHGREFPEYHDYWDGNWLEATARFASGGEQAEATGPFLRNDELAYFAGGLRKLRADLWGVAELQCLEPNLYIRMEGDGTGGIAVKLELEPENPRSFHEFEFTIEQESLPPLIAQCETIVERYPIRSPRESQPPPSA